MSIPSSFSDLRDLRDLSPDEKDEVVSLPSISTSEIYSDADSEAQEEWERSLEQLQLLLTMMVIPFVGKYFGRRFAYWSEQIPPPRRTCRLPSLLPPYIPSSTPLTTTLFFFFVGWGRYMEWLHGVEVRWTSKKIFNVVGAAEAATSL